MMAISAMFFIMGAYPMTSQAKRKRHGAVAALLVLAVACGGREEPPGTQPVELEALFADPGAHDGRRVRFRAFYVGSFELSVLTATLAESYPPQPAEPMIWVDREPRGDCVTTDVGVTWGEVVAEGVFRYEEEGGFGHLGVYRMQLSQARLSCP